MKLGAVLAMAQKLEHGRRNFRGGCSPTATGVKPNFQCESPDGNVERLFCHPKTAGSYEIRNYIATGPYDEANLSDVLDEELKVFLRGFRFAKGEP